MRAALLIISLAATPAAGDISLAFPLDCTLGETCYIQQYMDHDPSSGDYDFACGSLTYDTHSGTDFALPSLADQAAGVNVLAAAEGTVVGVRNDMLDIMQIGSDAPDITNRECGNGVVIRHAEGYETQYCHMTKGSVGVSAGQAVATGTVLGRIGLSGQTQFPHLHLSVRLNGQDIDPFNSDGVQTCPDPARPTLWNTEIATPAGGILTIGMSDGVPKFDDIKAGSADTGVAADGPAMVGWGYLFGVRIGDTVTTRITRPDGTVFDRSEALTCTQASIMRAFGKRTPQGGWAQGTYRLDVIHQRGDAILDHAIAAYMIN
jgi:hypothetical protein